MYFVVSSTSIRPKGRPTAVLRPDRWNDYGFVTMFHVTLWLQDGRMLNLEDVKVLELGMGNGGRVQVPDRFNALPDRFCSLGQAPSYYEGLFAAGKEVALEYLEAMRDSAAFAEIEQRFNIEPGFETSLLRFSSAEQALELGRQLFAGIVPQLDDMGQLFFEYAPPSHLNSIRFAFGSVPDLPTRLVALIGYNGVGKTQLLARLAMASAADDRELSEEAFKQDNGTFEGVRPKLGSVVAVSYSAFDDFAVPGEGAFHEAESALERDREQAGETSARRYTYIGLRRLDEGLDAGSPALKGQDEIISDFHDARRLATEKLREGQLRLILEPVEREPSFAMAGPLPDVAAEVSEWQHALNNLSAGHKIVLNIIVQLCARLERRSLVLLDEPEMHLHPPLVAALLRSIGAALHTFDSFAVVATHSPVVIQEIPGRNVLVLRRYGQRLRVEDPEIETYGENVSLLTTRVFNLDNSASDFQGVLRDLANRYTPDQIEALFGGTMSSQARAIVHSEQRLLESADDADG